MQAGSLAALAAAQQSHRGPGPAFTPLKAVLDAVSVPGYAVGRAIQNPATLLSSDSAIDIFRDEKKHVLPGQALRERGALDWVPDKFGLRGITQFAADVGLDPSTYVSFGAGAAVKGGVRAGLGRASAKYLDDIVKLEGRAPTIAEKARAAAMDAAERKAAQGSLKVGVRVPFTRGKQLLISESAGAHDAIANLARKLGGDSDLSKLAQQGITTGRNLDPLVKDVHRAVSAGARAEINRIADAALKLEHDVYKAEKKAGLKPGEGLRAITRHLGNPEGAHPLPAGLEEHAQRARDLLDEFNAAEKQAGIVYRERPHYVSLLGAGPKDRRRIANLYTHPSAAQLDEPFFIKPSVARSVDEFERIGAEQGFTPELNIARIIERRGRASVNARMKKALDEAVVEAEGVKPPLRTVPTDEKAAAKVADRQEALTVALAAGDAPAAARAQARLVTAQRQLDKRRGKIEDITTGNDALIGRPGRLSTPEEWRQVRSAWTEIGNATKYHAGTRLPPDVADSLKRVHERITPLVSSDTALRTMGQTVANITSRWKALALLSPGYHIRNLYDDGMRAYWAGARNPASFLQASKILKARKGKGDVARTYTINGETWTREELVRRAEALDIIDTGYAKVETHSSADATGRLSNRRGIPSKPGEGNLTRGSQAVGQYRENVIRLGTWLELLKRGDNPVEAARTVREFLFDYGDVGAFVEQARKFWAPFITYPSKAIAFNAREVARRPGRYANVNAAMTDLNSAAGNPDLSTLPIGSRSSFGVPVPSAVGVFLGGKPGQANLVNTERLFGFGAFNLLDPRRKNFALNAGGLVNPYIKAGVEDTFGYSTYFGRPFAKRVRAPLPIQLLHTLHVPIQGWGPKYDQYEGRSVAGYSPYLDTLLRTLPPFSQASTLASGDSDKTRSALARYLGGVPFSPYDRARAQFYEQKYGSRK